jgi:hypothetical protein
MSPLLLLDLVRTIEAEHRREAQRQSQPTAATAKRSER